MLVKHLCEIRLKQQVSANRINERSNIEGSKKIEKLLLQTWALLFLPKLLCLFDNGMRNCT